MHVLRALSFVVLAGLIAIAVAVAARAQSGVVASANGSAHWTIPLPNPFGVEVQNRTLSFNARKRADGSVDGRFEYHQVVEGQAFRFNVDVTCLQVYDGNRAKLGGIIVVSNDPTLPPGRFAWFQVFDNGEGANDPEDQSTGFLNGPGNTCPTIPLAPSPIESGNITNHDGI